jgi:hypothetical protein
MTKSSIVSYALVFSVEIRQRFVSATCMIYQQRESEKIRSAKMLLTLKLNDVMLH